MARIRLKSDSTSKSVVFSTFFSLMARVFSFVQAMIVSYYFGATKSTDFLFFCVSMTLLLPGLFTNINKAVIVPNAIRLREVNSEEESRRFISYIYFLYLAAGIVVCAVIGLLPERFMLLVSKFNLADIRENMLVVKMIIPVFFFILANYYLLDIFDSYKYFTFPMILDMIKSILTILVIIFLGKRYGVVSMAAGILLSYAVQFIVLNGLMIKMLGFRFSFRAYHLDSILRKNMFYVVISQVSSILSQYIAAYLISGQSEGVYTALSYSDRIYGIFSQVFAGQIATVLGINMIEMYAKSQYEKLNEQYLKYLKVSMTVVLPICFIMAAQAPQVISVLFERGSFTSSSVQLTSIFFRYTILIVPLLLLDSLIVRLIIARQIMRISFIWNVISKLLTCIVIYIIVEHVGFAYYGLGLLLVQLVYIILLNFFMVKKYFQYIHVNESLLYLAASVMLCTALSYIAGRVLPAGDINGILRKIASLCTYSVLVMGGYFLIGYATYNRETIRQLFRYLMQLLPGRFALGVSQTDKLT